MTSILKQALHSLSVGTVAGLAGGLVAGFGSRLAMRLSGALTTASNRGIATEAGFTVGEITPGGTIFLALFSAYVGIFGGLAYVSVKSWIPSTGRMRGLWFGLLLLVLFGPLVIEIANPDFTLFGPPWLNLLTFSGLFVLFGVVATLVADRLDGAEPARRLIRWSRVPTALIGALAMLSMFRMLVVGTWPSAEAEAAGSLAEEMISAGFNGFRYNDFALSPVQTATAALVLYVLLVLPLMPRVRRGENVGSDVEVDERPWRAIAGTLAFGLAVAVGACLTAFEFVAILGGG
jgi:hypothetical protein